MSDTKIFSTLIDLLRIRSFTNEEDEICNWTHQRLKQTLTGIPDLRIVRVKNALIVYGPQASSKDNLGFAGHFDTVIGTDFGDLVHESGDKIIGLGASDMKAGLAVMLELLNPEIISRSKYNLTFVFYDAEEGDHDNNGIIRVLESCKELSKLDFCFVLEPTANTLQLGCTGVLNAKVSFSGRRAHAARPWEGENALHKAGLLLTKLQTLPAKTVTVSGLEFKDTITATTASTGNTSRNVVPDEFTLNLNVRFSPNSSVADTINNVHLIVGNEAKIEIVDQAPSGPVPIGNKILDNFQSQFHLPQFPKQAYTDVAMFAAYGINAANCGPGLPAQAHQKGEYVLKSDVIKSYELFRTFLKN